MAVHEDAAISDHISQNRNNLCLALKPRCIAVRPKHGLGDEAQAPCLRKGGQDNGVGLRHISRQKKRTARKKKSKEILGHFLPIFQFILKSSSGGRVQHGW